MAAGWGPPRSVGVEKGHEGYRGAASTSVNQQTNVAIQAPADLSGLRPGKSIRGGLIGAHGHYSHPPDRPLDGPFHGAPVCAVRVQVTRKSQPRGLPLVPPAGSKRRGRGVFCPVWGYCVGLCSAEGLPARRGSGELGPLGAAVRMGRECRVRPAQLGRAVSVQGSCLARSVPQQVCIACNSWFVQAAWAMPLQPVLAGRAVAWGHAPGCRARSRVYSRFPQLGPSGSLLAVQPCLAFSAYKGTKRFYRGVKGTKALYCFA